MRVFALLSWYDEKPEHLTRCVTSLAGFADVLVALDGAYDTFPDAKAGSPVVQQCALRNAVVACGLDYSLTTPHRCWEGGEVAKRATLFEHARGAGATPEDWLLIIDGDMTLGEYAPDARDRLKATDCDVAEVRFEDVQIDGKVYASRPFRSMFRALPGLTVERTHFLYTVPADPCGCAWECPECYGFKAIDSSRTRRFLWLLPSGHPAPGPVLNLTGSVTLQHFNSQRHPDRRQRALNYYRDRDAASLETVGEW